MRRGLFDCAAASLRGAATSLKATFCMELGGRMGRPYVGMVIYNQLLAVFSFSLGASHDHHGDNRVNWSTLLNLPEGLHDPGVAEGGCGREASSSMRLEFIILFLKIRFSNPFPKEDKNP